MTPRNFVSACVGLAIFGMTPSFAAPAGVAIEKVEMEGSAAGRVGGPTQANAAKPGTPTPTPQPVASPYGIRPVAGAGPVQVKQSKSLHIWLRNRVRGEQPETIVRYWICGRDMKTNKAVIVDGGEETWKPGPAGTKEAVKEIISEPVSSSYQQKSTFSIQTQPRMATLPGVRPGMAGGGGVVGMGMAAPQTNSGIKIIGHAVQLIQYDKIVAESYIEPDLKILVGSTGTTPGAKFTKSESKEKE